MFRFMRDPQKGMSVQATGVHERESEWSEYG